MSDCKWPHLLLQLKVTVEALLDRQNSQVWSMYGGLHKLCSSLSEILHHGCKLKDSEGNVDLWNFIQGLNWLQPSLEGCLTPSGDNPYLPPGPQNKTMRWIYLNVENHKMSGKLAWLVSDREHLDNCYYPNAFLRQQQYAEAALICLKSLEINQPFLLADINPKLCLIPKNSLKFYQNHRRCSSLPVTGVDKSHQEFEMPIFSQIHPSTSRVSTSFGVLHGTIPQLPKTKKNRVRSKSLPAILGSHDPAPVSRPRTLTTSKVTPKVACPPPPPKALKPRKKQKVYRRRTFMEDGGTSVRPMATGYFPRPRQGQSLTSFFSNANFTGQLHGELDRENAHFRISEAMISAIEQVKCNEQLRMAGIESDEDGARGTQRGRRARWVGHYGTPTSEQTPTPPSSSLESPPQNPSPIPSSDDEEGSEAEQVALSLLRQFKDTSHQLPCASELEWLVSADDAPQELLPLPRYWSVAPANCPDTALRGTADWAPPRAQIIFTPHPPHSRKQLIAKQNSKCAGCGHYVAPEYTHKLRYCDYLGRYFCTRCHSNQLSIIPGRIVTKWDFTKYTVSDFAFKLLEQMLTDPLFHINFLNPALFKKVSNLEKTRQCRVQLRFLSDFLVNCRFAKHLQEVLSQEPPYGLKDPDLFSLEDLIKVRSGELLKSLRTTIRAGFTHVNVCNLCQARGFLCELCPSKEAIFPWNLKEVKRCDKCGACFHLKCFKRVLFACPRCFRIKLRK